MTKHGPKHEATHSVEGHLGLLVEDYDRLIRTYIPAYERMLQATGDALARLAPRRPLVLDLGAGNGALSAVVLDRLPEAELELWDVDRKMLDLARKRLGDRASVRFVERSFLETLPPCDVVVASLSLHHVRELPRKRALYAEIHRALRVGGLFLNADAVVATDPRLRAATFDAWGDFMKGQGIGAAEVPKHFAAWANEDTYYPLLDELEALEEAGFTGPECFFREGPVAVYGGLKAAPKRSAEAPR